jgi:hypothetical protein
MSYARSYHETEKKIKKFSFYIIYKNIHNNPKLINIFYKLISNHYNFFNIDILTLLIVSPNKNTGFIDIQFVTNLKNRFIKSIKLFIINQNWGIYLLKYYYTIFFIFNTYNSSIKYICTKIYLKSNKNKTKHNINYNTKQLYYSNINNINLALKKINPKYKFSYNDDNNYNLIHNIINQFYQNIKKNNIILFSKYDIIYHSNVYITLFQNIYNVYKNIYYIKKKS